MVLRAQKSVRRVPEVLQSKREQQPAEEKLSSYSPLCVGNGWKSSKSQNKRKSSLETSISTKKEMMSSSRARA